MAKAQHAARYKRLPGQLRQMREDAGLTQRALATKLSVGYAWVYKSEIGDRRIDLAEFCDWAKACGVDPIVAVNRFLGRL